MSVFVWRDIYGQAVLSNSNSEVLMVHVKVLRKTSLCERHAQIPAILLGRVGGRYDTESRTLCHPTIRGILNTCLGWLCKCPSSPNAMPYAKTYEAQGCHAERRRYRQGTKEKKCEGCQWKIQRLPLSKCIGCQSRVQGLPLSKCEMWKSCRRAFVWMLRHILLSVRRTK